MIRQKHSKKKSKVAVVKLLQRNVFTQHGEMIIPPVLVTMNHWFV